MPKPKHNQGRVETLRCAAEIAERRAAGESIRWVYLDLAERGDLTITYNTFLRWVGRLESGDVSVPARRRGSNVLTGRVATQSRDHPTNVDTAGDGNRNSSGPKHIGMGTPMLSPLNTEPDTRALFGEDQ